VDGTAETMRQVGFDRWRATRQGGAVRLCAHVDPALAARSRGYGTVMPHPVKGPLTPRGFTFDSGNSTGCGRARDPETLS
jgi:hypothetical protein